VKQTERKRRFDALFEAHSSDVVAYCGWRAGAGDAQDAVAEVFLTAWRRLGTRCPQGTPRGCGCTQPRGG
jgi:DNA-directed RNA polymerase specialized sigma24 family protein